jgi:hypothetical protein
VSEALFKDLHLDQKKAFRFQIGNMPVSVDSSTVTSDSWLPYSIAGNRKVEALLPAGIVQQYQVVIDYADRTLMLAQFGTLQPQGIAVPLRVNEKTGLITVDIAIEGRSYPVLPDHDRCWLGLHLASKIHRAGMAQSSSRLAAGHWSGRCQQYENGG